MATRVTKRDTIRGVEIETTQLPVLKSAALSTKWLRAIAPGIGAISPLILKGAGDEEAAKRAIARLLIDTSFFEESMTKLMNSITPQVLDELIRETLVATVGVHDGRRVEFSTPDGINLVIPDLKTCFAILRFVLEVNYGNFLEDAVATTPG